MENTTLYYREGTSDKVYHAAIEAKDGGFVVNFAYGRRGSTMSTGTKTPAPVPYETAKAVYDKLVASKTAKGYSPGEDGTPYALTGREGSDTGIRCQLLNPITGEEAEHCVRSAEWAGQEKIDGRRMLLRKRGTTVTGINRRGLEVALAGPLAARALAVKDDFLIDGEAMGDTIHAFDLLERDGTNLRRRPLIERLLLLQDLLKGSGQDAPIRPLPTATFRWEKEELMETVKSRGGEGVVFKRVRSQHAPGCPASGGDWLKLKFVETASFIVGKANAGRRSVGLVLLDGDRHVPAGNVTIPPGVRVPEPGEVAEVRYLYALRQSGSVYQPVWLGVRDDIPPSECVVSQLRFKDEPVPAGV